MFEEAAGGSLMPGLGSVGTLTGTLGAGAASPRAESGARGGTFMPGSIGGFGDFSVQYGGIGGAGGGMSPWLLAAVVVGLFVWTRKKA